MITKEEFYELAKASGGDPTLIENELSNFDGAVDAAMQARAAMPGIGFMSVKQRLNCFMAVCRHLDSVVESGELEESDAQIALLILRLKDRKFRKAISMFELRSDRYGARERAEMPRTARFYMVQLGAR